MGDTRNSNVCGDLPVPHGLNRSSWGRLLGSTPQVHVQYSPWLPQKMGNQVFGPYDCGNGRKIILVLLLPEEPRSSNILFTVDEHWILLLLLPWAISVGSEQIHSLISLVLDSRGIFGMYDYFCGCKSVRSWSNHEK